MSDAFLALFAGALLFMSGTGFVHAANAGHGLMELNQADEWWQHGVVYALGLGGLLFAFWGAIKLSDALSYLILLGLAR